MKIPIIKKKNFILRPFKKGDEFSLKENINNKKIAKNTKRIPYPYTLKDAKNWIKKNLKEYKKKKPKIINFVIEIDGKVAGSVGFSEIEAFKAEISYWLAEKYWNRGIMTEAVKLITKYGFKKLKLKRIYARVFKFNQASKRVLEKGGYKLEGLMKKDVQKDGKYFNIYIFAKVI